MKHLVLAGIAIGCFLTFGVSPASAGNITFDDISDGGIGTPIPNGYHGLNWANFNVLDTQLYNIPSGYVNGEMSPPNVAYNGFGALAAISSATPFTINSGYFTGAWNNGLSVTVTGFLNNNQLYTKTFTVNTSGPTFESINFIGVNLVQFTSSGGTPAGLGGIGTHFALDNLVVNGAVSSGLPEPTSVALFGIGAVVTSVYGWRRRVGK